MTAGGALIATYDALGAHFYLNDALGSRRVPDRLPPESRNRPARACPSATSSTARARSIAPQKHHFTGKERDTESGLDYFGARYYTSSMGRFMSPDDGSDWKPR